MNEQPVGDNNMQDNNIREGLQNLALNNNNNLVNVADNNELQQVVVEDGRQALNHANLLIAGQAAGANNANPWQGILDDQQQRNQEAHRNGVIGNNYDPANMLVDGQAVGADNAWQGIFNNQQQRRQDAQRNGVGNNHAPRNIGIAGQGAGAGNGNPWHAGNNQQMLREAPRNPMVPNNNAPLDLVIGGQRNNPGFQNNNQPNNARFERVGGQNFLQEQNRQMYHNNQQQRVLRDHMLNHGNNGLVDNDVNPGNLPAIHNARGTEPLRRQSLNNSRYDPYRRNNRDFQMRQNCDKMASFLWSMAKKTTYVPRRREFDNDENRPE